MNILFLLFEDTFVGGAEGVLHQVSNHYLQQGHQVYVWFIYPKAYGQWEDAGTPNLHLLYGGGIKRLLSNINKLRKIHFDYSFSSLVDLTGILGILRRLRVIFIDIMVGRESTSIFDRFTGFRLWRKRIMYYLGYPAVDILICQTSYMKNQLLANLPWIETKSKVVVIPNPVNIDEMMVKGKEEIDENSYTPYIVTAGRFIPEKGYDILIDAFARFHQKHNHLHLLIFGDGNLRELYEDQIGKLGLKDYVHLPGYTKNVFPWFRQAEMCVISSRVEGFPNVLLQMMSQNNRVVSTLCAGDVDKIKGLYTCQPNSCEELLAAMESAWNDRNVDSNRDLFDVELHNRSIDNFVNTLESIKI